MSAKYFQTILEYNRWANSLVLDRAALVPPEDYLAPAPGLSFGSLHGTLVHALAAEVLWLSRWLGGLPPESLRDARLESIATTHIRTFEELMAYWREEDAKQSKFIEDLNDEAVTSTIAYKTLDGEPHEQPLAELMAHFVNHGTQFRAEAAVRLSQLDLSPGDIDLIIYLRQR